MGLLGHIYQEGIGMASIGIGKGLPKKTRIQYQYKVKRVEEVSYEY